MKLLNCVLFATIISIAPLAAFAGERHAPATASVDENPCDSGYSWFAKIGKCRERHEARFVEKARCKPGTMREVPDPDRPGGYRVQYCHYLKTDAAGISAAK